MNTEGHEVAFMVKDTKYDTKTVDKIAHLIMLTNRNAENGVALLANFWPGHWLVLMLVLLITENVI